MLKKWLGLGKKGADRLDGAASQSSGESRVETPSPGPSGTPTAPTQPARPWLTVAWELSDVPSSVRVRRLAEGLADRAHDPSTIFGEFGGCDVGLVTLLVHKSVLKAGSPPLDREADGIMRRILHDAQPLMYPAEYVSVTCPCEGGTQQLIASRAEGSTTIKVERVRVREGEVIERSGVPGR